MTIPLLPLDQAAVFTDFDGTLVPIAATPDGVIIPPTLATIAAALHGGTRGAFALITGRTLDDLNALFDISFYAAAGSHGAQWQIPDQKVAADIGNTDTLFGHIRPQLYDFAKHHNLLLEDKRFALAIHFRAAPHLEVQLDEFLDSLLRAAAGVKLVRGKCVREIKPVSVNKGLAVARFMERAPFAGRTPYFVGDDTTDEDGFAWVNDKGGVSIKVGEGETCAAYRLPDCNAVLAFLQMLAGPA